MKYRYSVAVPEQGGKFIHRPLVEVEIFGPKGKLKEIALIDSGADRSLLNLEIAELLGIDLTRARTRTAIGISGATKVYTTEVEVKLQHFEKRVVIPVGFIDSPYVSVLLGQEGFFDQHRIKFEKDHDVFEIMPIRKKS